MNKERILRLSKVIKDNSSHFNLSQWMKIDPLVIDQALINQRLSIINYKNLPNQIKDQTISMEDLVWNYGDYIDDSTLRRFIPDHHNIYDYGVEDFSIFQNIEGPDKYSCMTTACIAGWAALMKDDFKFTNQLLDVDYHDYIPEIASDYLELSQSEAINLYESHLDSVWFLVAEEYEKLSFRSFLMTEYQLIAEPAKTELVNEIISEPDRLSASKEEHHYDYLAFLWNKIDAEIASDVLYRLATTDDIILSDESSGRAMFSESYIKNKKEKQNA